MSIQLSSRPAKLSFTHGFIRNAYSSPIAQSIKFSSVSPFTRQEFKDECDINVLMRRYQSTGELPMLNRGTAKFLDVSASMQFQESMNYVSDAQSMFNELPATVRDRFYNDPVQFLDFCSNPANRTDLAKMGLLTPEATRDALSPLNPPAPIATPTKAPIEPPKPE